MAKKKNVRRMAGGGVSRNRRMLGQDKRDETSYRFSGADANTRMDPVDFKVSGDIRDRDNKDIDEVRSLERVGKTPSKLQRAAYKEAVERQNRLGSANEGFNDATGKGYTLKEGDEMRKRLMKRYGVEAKAKGGSVKKYANGGSVKSSASKRGDGIAQRGKTKGKMR